MRERVVITSRDVGVLLLGPEHSAIDAKPIIERSITGAPVFQVVSDRIRHFTVVVPFPGASTLCGLALAGDEYRALGDVERTCDVCGEAFAGLRG